ncbi:MAG TPA: response regulator transcription factor [Alphaproteobacteria bacterium]|nr:response regulator transcription factor [Alphaproteobacteria bacterium]
MDEQTTHSARAATPVSIENSLEPSILLVDGYDLFREGMKLLLRELGYELVIEADGIASALGCVDSMTVPDLILFGIHPGNSANLADLASLRRTFSRSRLVCYSDPKIDPVSVLESLKIGIDGYVLTDIKPRVLKQSLDLILLGAPIYPAAVAVACLDQKLRAPRSPEPAPQAPLSLREKQILLCLINGCSNKMISRELQISEATVKVHVKLLLKKLNVTNRTQAAIWAVHNGIASSETVSSRPPAGGVGSASTALGAAPASRNLVKLNLDDQRKATGSPLPNVA